MIAPTTPIEIPAVEAKVADGLWITNLMITAPTVTGKIRVMANFVPFVSTTGEMFPEKAKQLRIEDIAALAETDTAVATAMAALFTALQGQVQAQNLF